MLSAVAPRYTPSLRRPSAHARLVQVPGLAGAAPAPGAQLIREQRSEAELPLTDGLVRDFEPALEQQLGNIAEAELVAQTPQHGEQHDVGGVLEIVERGAGPLVEDSAAGAARGRAVAERATSFWVSRRACSALTWAVTSVNSAKTPSTWGSLPRFPGHLA